MITAKLSATWQKAVTYFVPEEIIRDREAQNRARMFLFSHTLGPFIGLTVPLALYHFDPTPGWEVAVLAVAISLFWVFPFLLRRGIAYEKLVLLSVLNLNFNILLGSYHYGGVHSPTLPWVLIVPILSLFYMGGDRRLHPHLLAVTAGSFALFLTIYRLFEPPPNDMPAAAMLGLGTVSTVATLAYVATMAIYYARIYDAGVLLETEVRRRRAMADELRQAVVAAHRTGSAKSEFLARMSHELRTPLNSIIGYSQILQEEASEEADAPMQQDVQRILEAANYLIRLINMILDLSKMQAGRMRFDFHRHSVSALIDEAVAERLGLAPQSGRHIEVDIEPGLETVHVDRTRFLQIVDAILENALRNDPKGVITIAARGGCSAGLANYSIAITDNGSGIPEEVLGTLFRTFGTARSAGDNRYGGTGLSMAVCSQLSRAMGGNLTAVSEVGRGSTFTLTLPKAPEAMPLLGGAPRFEAAFA